MKKASVFTNILALAMLGNFACTNAIPITFAKPSRYAELQNQLEQANMIHLDNGKITAFYCDDNSAVTTPNLFRHTVTPNGLDIKFYYVVCNET